ncbi:MAG: hypothetical protein J5503_06540, partial [Muribaculaceae bacterium]|nr:hypothetical protein [Muribaculaceae bacterium]
MFNTIYDEKDYDGFEYDFLTSYPYDPDDTITVEVHKDNYCYSWRLLYDKNESAISLNFSFQEYINKIKRCFEELHAGWLSGKTLIYDKYDLSLDAIKVALEQLNAVATLPSCYPLHLNPSAFEEEFIFKFNGHIENYSIGIGNRVYSTWLTHWDNSFDKIHHQFESLFYDDEANIELSFDLSNTVIKIKKERIKWIQYEDGKPIQHDLRHMSVEIIPNDFVNMPIIKGFCNRKQTIKILYEGFMRFALRHSFD